MVTEHADDVVPAASVRPARDHCLAPGRADDVPSGGYGRLFPGLDPLAAGGGFFARHGRQAVESDESPFVAADDGRAGTDAAAAAGWPFLAQFIAHDITADRSGLSTRADIATLRNARRARLDLECVYGRGPAEQPYLMRRSDPAKMLIALDDTGRPWDLPRNAEGIAVIGDQRNDVHQPISQLHVAILTAHNRLVDRLREDGTQEPELFDAARRSLRWHLQWVVLHDYLPTTVGDELAAAVRDGDRRWYRPAGPATLPVEFADAAFRYGHSQIRERYRLNPSMPARRLFPDLVGFRPVPSDHTADWSQLFDLPGHPPAPQRAKKIDERLVSSLIRLPAEVTGDVSAVEHRSLAVRDLLRGLATGLPSGEDVAAAMGEDALSADEIGVRELGWTEQTPLWFYVLKEAQVRQNGDRLGPVGGRIVAEVLTAIIDSDPGSYRRADPDWTPSLPTAGATFGIGDLLVFAGG